MGTTTLVRAETYLSGDICNGSSCDIGHSMNTRVTRSRCFGLLLYRARRRENVFVRLAGIWSVGWDTDIWITNRYKDSASKQAIPWVFRIIIISLIQKYRPLIASYSHFTTLKFFFNPAKMSECAVKKETPAYSKLDQSSPAGHNSAPVRSWWNPRSVLTLRAKGGFRGWPRGVIQSSIADFKLFVSSALAPAEPFWIYQELILLCVIWIVVNERTSSATCMTSSSEPDIRRSSSPGIIWSKIVKTRCSRRSLNSYEWKDIMINFNDTYSCVKDSSGSSASSPMRRMPLFNNALTVHNACTVRPKCLPWCTRGSVPHLK